MKPVAASLLRDDTLLSTGFGPMGADSALELSRSRSGTLRSSTVFDVCHVGVVLRALLFVHGVLAIGTAFMVAQVSDWGLQFSVATAIAMPALLCWLVSVCVAKEWLVRWPVSIQWLALTLWGAACAAGAAALWSQLQWAESAQGGALHAWAQAATGGAMAAAFFLWLRQRARLEQPAAAAARLAELQSRIRPHFLFNTLNTAIALVRVDPARAESVLEDLAELFRVALSDNDPQASASLQEEVELARRYLAIEQVRFGDRLDVKWDLDPAANPARLPPLLLQPLVENAVRHGVEPSANGGMVRVRTRLRRGRVEILVANSVPAEGSRPGHGIGLQSVRDRLRLMHDVAGDFSAGLDTEVYRVRISVPL